MPRLLLAFLFLALAFPAFAQPAPSLISPDAIANPPGLPAMGKWMIDREGSVAHWLGEVLDGKRLYEPINVILIIDAAQQTMSADEAKDWLVAAARTAGYPVRFGHSTGYRGLIGGALYAQLPQGREDAFSNRVFELSNNHGRVFGPHRFGGAYVFIGAFSRERVNLLRLPGHRYASFNRARDDFARDLVARAGWRAAGTVPLGNAIAGDPQITTGDHDGRAVVLRRER